MRRVPTTELLDHDAGSAEEVATALADLRRINRWFGGISTTMAMIRQVARSTEKVDLSWLEIAAATGDVPRSARDRLAKWGIRLQVTLLDRARSHLVNRDTDRRVVADALALPFRDASFDLVGCGLFTHHLSPQQLVRFVDEGLRVARVAVLINDLIRHRLHVAAVYAGMPLYRGRLTWHDGPASVRQAYTVEEMRAMLVRTQASRVEIARHYLFRMGAIVWKV
jgi:ubiquinone/menaquinone biosynthesis C-methylase UbiE